MGRHPVLVGRLALANNVQKVIRAARPQESEALDQVGGDRVEVLERLEITFESVVLAIQVEDRLRIGNGCLDFAPIANQALVLSQAIDVIRSQGLSMARVDGFWIEFRAARLPASPSRPLPNQGLCNGVLLTVTISR